MTRRLSVLFVLAFFVISLGSLAFAAKAKTASQKSMIDGATVAVPLPRLASPADNDGGVAGTSGKPRTTQPTAMGFFMVNPGEVGIGTSDIDWQFNDCPTRRVAIGSDSKIHTAWMYRMAGLEPPTANDRFVYYNGYQANSTPSIPLGSPMASGVPGSGYPSIAVAPGEALAYAAYHYTKAGTGYDIRSRTAIGKQAANFSPVFNMVDYPSSDSVMSRWLNCTNYHSGMDTMEAGYIWPSIATDVNGSGQTIVHCLTKESNNYPNTNYDTTGIGSLVYYRTAVDAAGPGVCGTVIDTIKGSIKYEIVADPTSDKVAAIYCRPNPWRNDANDGYAESNEDVFYKESSDLGVTWPSTRSAVLMPGKIDSVMSGTSVMWQRANEVSGLYSEDGCLHVLYQTGWDDPIGHTYLPLFVRLTHWSSCTPTHFSVVVDGAATWGSSGARPPYFKLYVSMASLAQCKVGASTRLYAVYTLYPDSTGLAVPNNVHADASANATPILNGDVCISASTDVSGALWGAPINITNTNSNGCTSVNANCFSESFTNAALYSNDSLRIQYMVDKDAGYAMRNATGSTAQGVLTENPLVIKTYQCVAPAAVALVAASVDSIVWPFHTTPSGAGHTNSVPVTFTNTGNTAASYTRTMSPSATWLSFVNPATGTVPVGWPNTLDETITATGPATEGYYRTTVTWTYTWVGNPGASKTVQIPVELYNYAAANWFIDVNNSIHTSYVTMSTNQTSRIGKMRAGAGFNFESDGTDTAYFYDGSLFLGKDSLSLSCDMFADTLGGIGGHGDPLLGRLFCLDNMVFDEVGVTPQGYRHSSGKGTNKDSSIAFDVDFYAPKHVDSSMFMIGKFSLYSGPKAPAATIPNVMVAYSIDMDVPDDSNVAGVDAALQMVYQRGKNAALTNRFGAMSGWRDDNTPIAGGMVLLNRRSIHRLGGYVTDSIWTTIKNLSGFIPTDSVGDLHSMLVFDKAATIKPKATGVYTIYVLFAGQPGHQLPYVGSLDNLKSEFAKAKKFMCNWLSPNPLLCLSGCNSCGDANNDGAIDIADAVFLITYIFKGGTAPADCNYANGKGDANGDLAVDIADAVYLITYIFKGGALPHCNGM